MTIDPATDERFLRRAIRLAMNGRGRVEPNPTVGCVIVRDGRVIGEGYHQQFGGPHAEPNALAACIESPAGATAYVTLEPCCHTDKKTPPCAPRLIREKVARVVVGCLDPNPAVIGGGVRMLREAGVRVDGPVLEAECKQLIAAFLKGIATAWPYTTVKWAESSNGRIAGHQGRPVKISNRAVTRLVHTLRSRSDSIVVGIGTVLTDDPLLTPRDVARNRTPTRVVLDSHLRTPLASRLVTTAREVPTWIFCSTPAAASTRADHLRSAGVIVDDLDAHPDPRMDGALSLTELLIAVGGSHQLIEAGPTIAAGYFGRNVADRLWVIRSPNGIDDPTAPPAAAVPDHYVATGTLDLDGDRLTEYLNTRSPAYFAPVPSADLVLAGSDLAGGG